jgi:hypothetical protein
MTKRKLNDSLSTMVEIDCCYWQLSQIKEEWDKPLSLIERQIDNATGKTKQEVNAVKVLLRRIIRLKEKYQFDASAEHKILNEFLESTKKK